MISTFIKDLSYRQLLNVRLDVEDKNDQEDDGEAETM